MKMSVYLCMKKEQQTTILARFTRILILPTLGFGVQSSNSPFKANVLASAFAASCEVSTFVLPTIRLSPKTNS